MIKSCLNPEGHQNSISGSKVTAILLKGWIWPIGEASEGEGLRLQPAQQACFQDEGSLYLYICQPCVFVTNDSMDCLRLCSMVFSQTMPFTFDLSLRLQFFSSQN